MKRAPLIACPACSRHVRATEASCPFCAASLAGRQPPPPRVAPAERLSRSAVFALGAVAVGVAACGDRTDLATAGVDASTDSPASATDATDATDASDATDTSDVLVLAPPPEAGLPDVAAPFDSGFGDVNVAVPYGIPPMK
jgi:hypothetical protein